MNKIATYFIPVILIMVLLSGNGFRQTDSLLQALEKAGTDTDKIEIRIKLGQGFSKSNPDTALYFLSEALVLAKKIEDKNWISKCYLSIGSIYEDQGEFLETF